MRYRNGDDLYKLCASGLADAAGPPGHDLGFAWGSGERGAACSERIARTRGSAVVAGPSQPPLAPPGVGSVPLEQLGNCLDGRGDNHGVAGLEPGERIYGFRGGRDYHSTALCRLGARDYSPVSGRWMEQEPAGYVDGSNRYQGLDDAPASLLDPSGALPVAATPEPQTAFPQTSFPIAPVYEGDVPIHLSAGVNVTPHLSSNPADSYFSVQASVSRSIDTAYDLDLWNTTVAKTLPANAGYNNNDILDANLLLFVDINVLGSAARFGQDYLEVDAEASGGDIERGWPSYQTTRSWHATDGQRPPVDSYAEWRNLTAAQKEAWTSAVVNSVTSSELDFPLPCVGSGHVNVNLFYGERARFGNKDWGAFVVNWVVDNGGRFHYNVVQNTV